MRLISILFIIVFFVGCKTDSTILEFSPPLSTSIIGQWNWVKTRSAWTGKITTPDDLGYTLVEEFGVDSTLETYKVGILDKERKYYVVYSDSNKTRSEGVLYIINESSTYFTIENNELITSAAYVDGPTIYYKRLKIGQF
jgi:hypothetical protein